MVETVVRCENQGMQRSGDCAFLGKINGNSRHPVMAVLLLDVHGQAAMANRKKTSRTMTCTSGRLVAFSQWNFYFPSPMMSAMMPRILQSQLLELVAGKYRVIIAGGSVTAGVIRIKVPIQFRRLIQK